MLDEVNEQIGRNDIHLSVTQAAKEKLVDLGYNPAMGARPLRRTIQKISKIQLLTSILNTLNTKNWLLI